MASNGSGDQKGDLRPTVHECEYVFLGLKGQLRHLLTAYLDYEGGERVSWKQFLGLGLIETMFVCFRGTMDGNARAALLVSLMKTVTDEHIDLLNRAFDNKGELLTPFYLGIQDLARAMWTTGPEDGKILDLVDGVRKQNSSVPPKVTQTIDINRVWIDARHSLQRLRTEQGAAGSALHEAAAAARSAGRSRDVRDNTASDSD